ANFVELFSTDKADAGWDISVTTNPANPISDLKSALTGSDINVDDFQAVGRIDSIAYENSEVRNVGTEDWKRVGVNGMDAAYMDAADIPLEARAQGYASDADVWAALRGGEKVAIVDANTFVADEFGNDPDAFAAPKDVSLKDGTFEPFQIEVN